jgi:hypothetical protein
VETQTLEDDAVALQLDMVELLPELAQPDISIPADSQNLLPVEAVLPAAQERAEEKVYRHDHGSGRAYEGTLTKARELCPVLARMSIQEATRMMAKNDLAERLAAKGRERREAESVAAANQAAQKEAAERRTTPPVEIQKPRPVAAEVVARPNQRPPAADPLERIRHEVLAAVSPPPVAKRDILHEELMLTPRPVEEASVRLSPAKPVRSVTVPASAKPAPAARKASTKQSPLPPVPLLTSAALAAEAPASPLQLSVPRPPAPVFSKERMIREQVAEEQALAPAPPQMDALAVAEAIYAKDSEDTATTDVEIAEIFENDYEPSPILNEPAPAFAMAEGVPDGVNESYELPVVVMPDTLQPIEAPEDFAQIMEAADDRPAEQTLLMTTALVQELASADSSVDADARPLVVDLPELGAAEPIRAEQEEYDEVVRLCTELVDLFEQQEQENTETGPVQKELTPEVMVRAVELLRVLGHGKPERALAGLLERYDVGLIAQVAVTITRLSKKHDGPELASAVSFSQALPQQISMHIGNAALALAQRSEDAYKVLRKVTETVMQFARQDSSVAAGLFPQGRRLVHAT